MTSSQLWDAEDAARYEASSSEMYTPEVLEPTLDFLERRAGPAAHRSALELAIGTGRVGVPLRRRGVAVQGIELSPHMVAVLRRTADEQELPVAVGDMATTVVDGEFGLVYLVFNTLANLRTQAEQVQCFRNAARHLRPGGFFVIEIWVPPLRRLPPGQLAAPFDVTEQHLGFDTYDLVTQRGTSHHFTLEHDGSYRRGESLFRFVWPSECDLMAQLAGLQLHERYADWDEPVHLRQHEPRVGVAQGLIRQRLDMTWWFESVLGSEAVEMAPGRIRRAASC